MRESIRVILLTLAVFIAGLIAGVWTQRLRPLVPPPPPPFADFMPHGRGAPPNPENMTEVTAKLERLGPELKAFEQSLDDLGNSYRTKIKDILNPEQQQKFEEKFPLHPKPDDPYARNYWHPDRTVRSKMSVFTIISPAQVNFTTELGLDPKQQEQLRQMLIERRVRFLEIVDKTPPPVLELGRMLSRPNTPQPTQ